VAKGAADEAFIREHEDRVRGIAVNLARELGALAHVEDLIAYGYEGLLEARERWDESTGGPFGGFAYYRIRGAMIDGLIEIGGISRRMLARVQAENLRIGEAAYLEREQRGPERNFDKAATSLDSVLSQITGGIAVAHLAYEEETPETKLLAALDVARLSRALGRVKEPWQTVLRRIYFEEHELAHIAADLKCDPSTVSRAHYRGLELLRESLG
jgi:RNA polymerase sigma factor for flagellar operon FliA